MSSETTDRKPSRPQNPTSSQQLPKITEPLPCPRCDSLSTKFCYYNNYNLSQPRHFCKACRRYWTQGGTLRNVPVGGGTRKSTKRTRTSSSYSSTSSYATGATSSSSTSTLTNETTSAPANSVPVLPSASPKMGPVSTNGVNLNESGNFTAMLNMQGHNFLGLAGGFPGYGLGSGFEELDIGFGGTRVWDVPGASYGINGHNSGGVGVGVGGGGSVGGVGFGCNTWQMMSNDDHHDQAGNGAALVVGDQDCFAWSGLAISTPGKGLK
ncbi:hypothetical protein Ddye_006948 [Dipteronia dyeriana]|uniref:Dof zinc finger protein n=1 Tax=Dipteronia dyeriana TaxID=168575 RepID=A0AAE0CR13_9ROSI|nr:hypothetical protein Ddye_006948 [Dipteronia dyeriana]